jgi:hypothetical protein
MGRFLRHLAFTNIKKKEQGESDTKRRLLHPAGASW